MRVFAEAQARVPLRLLAYCVMPNHFHLVAWPSRDDELSEFMHWLTLTHSKRWHVYRGTNGTGPSIKVDSRHSRSKPIGTFSRFAATLNRIHYGLGWSIAPKIGRGRACRIVAKTAIALT